MVKAKSSITYRHGWLEVAAERSVGLFATTCLLMTSRAVDIPVIIPVPRPENVAVYVGDTVVWHTDRAASTESYTGEWKSPVFRRGETFSYTFTKAGVYVCRIGWYSDSTPPVFVADQVATVTVQPFEGERPAISIVTPPDGFLVPRSAVLSAVVYSTRP